ncbi:hypothetical protein E5Q_06148 [Mixia osmundae IAM 14324]|uniref:VPS10 domain-containing protein n=2 Tax=Mixia osmundae (strain CBS 9802 / IAM 14324 / JCM 22182 / KY 12970) TaxID=764103 RepID=G7E9Y0_MIXOS|nr:hypothetical protein E5Q_06148 [Mixia osmundae IAM 14324]
MRLWLGRPPKSCRSCSSASNRRAQLLWLAILGLLCPLQASAQKPTSSFTRIENLPSRLFYFDDTPVILYHDAVSRDTWRSPDEGKTWELAKDVTRGESWTIVEHPYDNRMAFIMSRDRKHYRTIDRGLTWQHFEAPLPVAVGVPALTFHSRQPEWILYTGQDCESDGGWLGKVCYDVSFVTRDAFSSDPKKMLEHTSKCIWAHSTLEAAADVPDEQIFCVAFEAPSDNASSGGMRSLKESRLYASTDFFDKDRRLIDLGIGKEARGLVGIGGIKKYLVVALRPPSAYNGGTDSDGADQMLMYVSKDATNWSRAMFPHGHGLKENAYTIVESTSHSILVDVLTDPSANSGTLFTSNSDGVFFVRSLENTNRNVNGIVDFEKLQNIEGVAIANTVANADEVKGGQQAKDIVSKITWDDGGHWQLIAAPKVDHKGKAFKCDVSNVELCSLHLHSVTAPHNFGRVFSSTAPGLVMGVGSVGDHLLDYDDCDTFLSTDAGVTWRMIDDGPHKYEFGDAGSILVLIEDDEATDHVKYSFDHGKTWEKLDFDVKIRAKLLTTVPDSTSLKFLVLGTLDKGAKSQDGNRHAIVYLDFATMNKRHCEESRGDFEKWYARAGGASAPDCLMGHKQWFQRRKADADCVVGEKFKDPVGTEENCPCTNDDYECDFNYVPDKKLCVLAAPEVIPPGQCQKDGDQFLGSSGYRKIPGNSCQPTPGLRKDEKVMKDCSEGKQAPGKVTHQRTDFDSLVLDQQYFADSHALLAYTLDQQVWQSDNEGFAWRKLALDGPILAMTMHAYARDHAYLITSSRKVHYTTNRGEQWATFEAPMEANGLGIPVLDFHPTRAEWLLWTGSKDCTSSVSTTCQAVAFMSKDNGRNWKQIEHYIRTCSWARDKKFKIDETMIFCESYRTKSGSQRAFEDNALELIAGRDFYNRKQKLFDSVVGFATFEEYMVVAEYIEATGALNLRVSLDGKTFAKAQFPPSMRLESQAYTVLESVTDAVFLHVTTHPTKGSEWGSLLKSNSNGTYFAMSLEYVNRNERGFADFEKAIGLDGIAVMNIVSNPEDASVTARKDLQTRITHNDGGRWKSIPPPARDSLNQPFACQGTKCSLHLHGYTERTDPRATYSSPTAVGLMVAVGNVGEKLGAYNDGDLFLTRDAGFTWQEVRKDAHLWEYGDQGSIIVIANDEQATDRISYTTDEGDSWQDYVFGEAIRVQSIMTVPSDTSRRFVLFGYSPKKQDVSVAIHLDFSKLSNVKCKLDLADPNADDFELWSPSENRQEECLFGRQTLYHRRIRGRSCYIGERLPEVHSIVRNCTCSEEDFECEFNHRRNAKGECELVEGAFALPSDPGTCGLYDQFWNERTAYRKIPYSSCQGGLQLDKGAQHTCPGHSRHGWFWWIFVVAICGLIAGLFGLWWMRRRAKGSIRLPEPGWDDSSATSMLASVPYHLLGVASAAFAWLQRLPMPKRLRPKRGYRLPHEDDDAQLLFDDEE